MINSEKKKKIASESDTQTGIYTGIFAEKLIKMKSKIAITGWPGGNKTLLAQALSDMTGIPYIRTRTMYEWRKCFHLSETSKMRWKEMFLIAAASFFDRVATESYYDRFISDGASFSELIWLKSHAAKQTRSSMKNERSKLMENLEYISATHAAAQYDFIVHAGKGNQEDLYMQLYMKYGMTYREYETENIVETISEIAKDLHLPVIHSAVSSVFQAKMNLYLTVSIWKPKKFSS